MDNFFFRFLESYLPILEPLYAAMCAENQNNLYGLICPKEGFYLSRGSPIKSIFV